MKFYVLMQILFCINQQDNTADSAVIYYLPLSSSFSHHISESTIDNNTDPYIITDSTVLMKLHNVLFDSLLTRRVKKGKAGDKLDVRIFIKYYSKHQLIKEIIIGQENSMALIDKKPVIISNIGAIRRFVRYNVAPKSPNQEAFFKGLKKIRCE
ncbi:MAG: hypothetical protein QM802_04835 [Agriterribacter sp.]